MTVACTRRVTKVPGYLLHKKSWQARVRLNGVDHYLGPYGSNEFGPIALKAVRQIMIGVQTRTIRKKVDQVQWTRRYINMSVSRIRRMFKWAVENIWLLSRNSVESAG